MNEQSPTGIRDLILAAFSDAESTIRATDTKASIALVVHGFLFAGVLGVLTHVGSWFAVASCSFRAAVIVVVGATAIAFIASVAQLLRCVAPAPARAVPTVKTKGVFYLQGSAGSFRGTADGTLSFEQLRGSVDQMTEDDTLNELLAEHIKVSSIRARKVALAKSGLGLLGAEIGLSVILLVMLAVHQL
jgi:hypothetical protein